MKIAVLEGRGDFVDSKKPSEDNFLWLYDAV